MIEYGHTAKFPPTFLAPFLICLIPVFEYADVVEPAVFEKFVDWLAHFSKTFITIKPVQVLIVRFLTTLLSCNPSRLRPFLPLECQDPGNGTIVSRKHCIA
jgi:hypothetical protein